MKDNQLWTVPPVSGCSKEEDCAIAEKQSVNTSSLRTSQYTHPGRGADKKRKENYINSISNSKLIGLLFKAIWNQFKIKKRIFVVNLKWVSPEGVGRPMTQTRTIAQEGEGARQASRIMEERWWRLITTGWSAFKGAEIRSTIKEAELTQPWRATFKQATTSWSKCRLVWRKPLWGWISASLVTGWFFETRRLLKFGRPCMYKKNVFFVVLKKLALSRTAFRPHLVLD